MKPTVPQRDYIERVGRWWESVAGSRAAGRILGWLMICEPVHQSSLDLMGALQMSSGSVSTQTRFLEQLGIVEKVTFAGDRAAYYQLRPNVWEQVLWSEHARIQEMHELALAASGVLPDDRPDRVTELARLAEFLIQEWPPMMKRLSESLEKERTN